MQTLASALRAWSPREVHPGDALGTLQAQWPQIVGEEVAANTRPAEITRDALVIVTRSSAWSQQLTFLSERVLRAIQERTADCAIRTLRFRVGRVQPARTFAPARRRTASPRAESRSSAAAPADPAPTLEAAIERFRVDVAGTQRAQAAAGWKLCARCGARTQNAAGSLCVPCENAQAQERERHVARLLFEAPWLGYEGIAPLVPGLRRHAYEAVRLALLRRWKDTLERIRREPRRRPSTRERSIASSYVLLKTELDPDKIAPVVVRNLLGDELHDIFYGSDDS